MYLLPMNHQNISQKILQSRRIFYLELPDRDIETIESGKYSNSPDVFDIVYPKRLPVYSDTDTDGEECELDDAHLPPRECIRP